MNHPTYGQRSLHSTSPRRVSPAYAAFGTSLLLWLAACGSEVPRLPALSPDAVVLAFGDSLTSGVGASLGQDYPSQLARITGFTIVNAGVPTELTADAAERLPIALDEYTPDLLILIHGGNDLLRKLPNEQTSENLSRMVAEARSRGVSVIMLGVPKPAVFGLSSAELYVRLAESTGIPADLQTLPRILGDESLKSDLVHPNDSGYRHLAEAIAELLQRSGAWNGVTAATL